MKTKNQTFSAPFAHISANILTHVQPTPAPSLHYRLMAVALLRFRPDSQWRGPSWIFTRFLIAETQIVKVRRTPCIRVPNYILIITLVNTGKISLKQPG
jgi:hypothetical protein